MISPKPAGRTIVYRSEIAPFTIQWNGSSTFNLVMGGKDVECFTVYGVTDTPHAARVAREWLIDNYW